VAGRVLALDPGAKRVGVALSDPLGIAVQALAPLDASRGRRNLLAEVAALIVAHQPAQVVVGLPRNTDGSEGPGALGARRLAAEIEAAHPGVEVVMYDERFTTILAEQVLLEADVSRAKRRRLLDGQAAVVLLADYLRSRSALDRESAVRAARIGVKRMATEDREDIVILSDDEGNEVEFLFLDAFEVSGRKYAVLVPLDDESEEDGDEDLIVGSEAMIFRLETDADGDEVFAEIEDDAEWAEVTAAWEDLQDEEDLDEDDDKDEDDEEQQPGGGWAG